MKTIKVDGSIFAVVESDTFCDGCIFHSETGCEAVNIPEIQCGADLREDGKNVIFEELEKFKEHTAYPVGKVLAFEGEVVEVVKVVGNNNKRSCDGCALRNYYSCFNVPCIPAERVDGSFIKFKKHVTEE